MAGYVICHYCLRFQEERFMLMWRAIQLHYHGIYVDFLYHAGAIGHQYL